MTSTGPSGGSGPSGTTGPSGGSSNGFGLNNTVCPPGFERGLMFSCRVKCPAEFKYLGESTNTVAPGADKCVHILRNNRFVELQALPQLPPGETPSSTYQTELNRVLNTAEELKLQVRQDDEEERELMNFELQRGTQQTNYSNFESSRATYVAAQQGVKALEDITSALKPMRAKVAPGAAIQLERKSILEVYGYSLFLVQLALAILIASFISYLTLPTDYAHAITFLLLCTGISVGFFLRK
jgi:hypothetical protein